MPISVEQLHDESIIVVTYTNPIENLIELTMKTIQQIAAMAEEMESPIYRINDVRNFNLSFTDMVMGMAEETRSGIPGSLGDPRITTLSVGSAELIRLGSEAAKQSQYGAINIQLFVSMDEALAHARGEIAKKQNISA